MGGDPEAARSLASAEEARVFLCLDRGQSAFHCPHCRHHVHTPDVRCPHCGADVSLMAQSLRMGPDRFNEGLDAFRGSRYGEAIAALRSAAWLMPEQPRCHLLLAKALAFRGDHAEARRVLLDARARSLVADAESAQLLAGFEALERVQHSRWQLFVAGIVERLEAAGRRLTAAARAVLAGAAALWGSLKRLASLLAPRPKAAPAATPAPHVDGEQGSSAVPPHDGTGALPDGPATDQEAPAHPPPGGDPPA